jgi:hypothetical protein
VQLIYDGLTLGLHKLNNLQLLNLVIGSLDSAIVNLFMTTKPRPS